MHHAVTLGVGLSTHLKEKFFTRGSGLYAFVAHSAQYCALQMSGGELILHLLEYFTREHMPPR